MRAKLGQQSIHATVDFGSCDLKLVHPSLDGRLVPVRVASGQLECDIAPLSRDSSRDGSGDLESL